jgi:hypothetical protein
MRALQLTIAPTTTSAQRCGYCGFALQTDGEPVALMGCCTRQLLRPYVLDTAVGQWASRPAAPLAWGPAAAASTSSWGSGQR